MPKEGREVRIDAQIAQIDQKLQRGTELIKQGHRVAGVNPDGSAVEVPLSPTKREKLQWNREVLLFRRDHRQASLPYELESSNPNHIRTAPLPNIDFSKKFFTKEWRPRDSWSRFYHEI